MNKGDYPDDNFTEADVLACLEAADLQHGRGGGRYILTQCPLHEDSNPSAQIYTDDWFVKCHAGCEGGRFHITKAFPELRQNMGSQGTTNGVDRRKTQNISKSNNERKVKYKTYDLYHEWENLPKIPRDHEFKTIPLEVLDEMGWRWDEYKESYFIPYFNTSRTQIPYGQWRHLKGNRRFTFLPEAKQIAYGLWNLENEKLFVVEGPSDCAVLEYANVPWIGMPSAASGELMKRLAGYCKQNGIELIYAGDNDSAGDKLRQALDEVMPYRVCQPPKEFKDWGDFLVATDPESIADYCMRELMPYGELKEPGEPVEMTVGQDFIRDSAAYKNALAMGGVELNIVGSEDTSKERSLEPTTLF